MCRRDSYTAAYLNAVEGANYDVAKLLDWVFDGCQSPTGRTGWGIIVGKWGDYDVSGLQGSITDGGGYAVSYTHLSGSIFLISESIREKFCCPQSGNKQTERVTNKRLFFIQYSL